MLIGIRVRKGVCVRFRIMVYVRGVDVMQFAFTATGSIYNYRLPSSFPYNYASCAHRRRKVKQLKWGSNFKQCD